MVDSSASKSETLVVSFNFDAQRFVVSQVCLATVVKVSVGAVFLHLEGIFELEGRERLRFKVLKMRVEERERVEV